VRIRLGGGGAGLGMRSRMRGGEAPPIPSPSLAQAAYWGPRCLCQVHITIPQPGTLWCLNPLGGGGWGPQRGMCFFGRPPYIMIDKDKVANTNSRLSYKLPVYKNHPPNFLNFFWNKSFIEKIF